MVTVVIIAMKSPQDPRVGSTSTHHMSTKKDLVAGVLHVEVKITSFTTPWKNEDVMTCNS